jgi:hypothetical protein
VGSIGIEPTITETVTNNYGNAAEKPMIKLLAKVGFLIGIALLCYAAPAASQEPSSEPEKIDRIRDRFYLRAGTYAVGYSDATLNIFSRNVLGINLDVEKDLDLDSPGQVARFDGYYRFTKKHALGFSYYKLKQSGSTRAGREITLPDPREPDGSITFPVGANVDSFIDTEIFKLNYIWFFHWTPDTSMGLNVGLNVSRIETGIEGELIVGDPVSVEQVTANVAAPLPVVGFLFAYKPVAGLRLIFDHNAFFLNYDKYEGSFFDTSVLAEYRFWRNVGIGGGINYNTLNLTAKDDDSSRRMDLQHDIGALQLYIFFRDW